MRANAAHLGNGLGLSIVGSIARQHGASFSLTSPVPGRSSGLQAMLVFAATDQLIALTKLTKAKRAPAFWLH